jgi:hypothetical protein
MKPRERRDSGQGDPLRSRLDAIIGMDHQLVALAQGGLGLLGGEARRSLPGWPRPAAAADAADGGADHPQIHLRSLRRGAVRALGGEPLLSVLLRGGVLPARAGSGPQLADTLAPAHGRGEDECPASGEPVDRGDDQCGQALRALGSDRRHDGRAQERDVPHRCKATQPGPRDPGAAGQAARRGAAPILCSSGQVRTDQASALCPCQAVQARQSSLEDAADLFGPRHP